MNIVTIMSRMQKVASPRRIPSQERADHEFESAFDSYVTKKMTRKDDAKTNVAIILVFSEAGPMIFHRMPNFPGKFGRRA